VWKPEDYGGIRSINLPPSYIWTPDIELYNRHARSLLFLSIVALYIDSIYGRFRQADYFSYSGLFVCKAVVTTMIRLRFDCNSTALRLFDVIRYDRAGAPRPK